MDIYSYTEFIFMRLLFPIIAYPLLISLPLSLSSNLHPLCHQEEKVALIRFKDSFIIKNNPFCAYYMVSSWSIDGNNSNCCAWDGVECDQDTGHVISLDLSNNCLYGSITSNSSLFCLLHLKNLFLYGNDFNDSQIPPEIGNLYSLIHLNLAYSHFSGQIPSEIQYLSKLSFLSLSSFHDYNVYTKSLTSLVQNLTNLEMLEFEGINVSSTIPESLANLSSLYSLSLVDCRLYGQFPNRIFQLPQLHKLDVSGNKDLIGNLPEFCTSSPLAFLHLSNTNFSGNLPASIGNLNFLTTFSIANCNFSGTIPNSFSNLTHLINLNLSNNPFHDLSWLTTASSNNIIPQFRYLALAYLNLTKFPDILRNQSQLELLDLKGNKLHGMIPKWMHNVSKESLQVFYVPNNFLTGFENSLAIFPWPNVYQFSLGNNLMQGSLPIPPPSLRYYLVHNNSFTGGISPLFCNMSSPYILDFSYNNLIGMIHPCLGNFSQSLIAISLQSNNFDSTIPKTWAKGCSLKMINLSQNQLQGQLPRSLVNCTKLEYLHVGSNQINDTSPFWLGTLQQLKILDLHSNDFYGEVRSSETNYTFCNLHIIDLSHNHFSGNLPTRYFAKWIAMKSYVVANKLRYLGDDFGLVDYSITITTKGLYLEYKKIQDDLTVIDFSCNRFDGKIPKQLGDLKGLHVLNLFNNAFIGHIPSSFGNLTQLESLDLSQNKLFGNIPPELTQLNFLETFKVSNNCLTGPIPHGQQFDIFPNSSFEDNSGLCGRPLSKICGDSHVSTPSPSKFEENQGPKFSFEFGWKVVAMGYGCGFVIGVVIGHIVTIRRQDWVIKIFGMKK